MLRSTTATVAVLAALMAPADAGAQALAEIGTDNRGQAIGDLTDAQIAEALRAEGRVTMSGTFFETDSAQLIDVNRPDFTGGPNSRRIGLHGQKEAQDELVPGRVPRAGGADGRRPS